MNILKRSLTLVLTVFVLNLSFGTFAFAQAQDDKEAQRERDAQVYVNKRGVGKRSRVLVRQKDDKKVKGYISTINDESFVITDKNGTTTTVRFSNVQKISRPPSPARTLLIAGGIILAIGLVVGLCASAGPCDD